jgi:hypothetical protein
MKAQGQLFGLKTRSSYLRDQNKENRFFFTYKYLLD